MQPTENMVFVKEIKKQKPSNGKYEVAGEYEAYQVEQVGKNVSSCKKGDFVLFRKDQATMCFYESEIIVVNESDIMGVAGA